jgi:hypothetical protein
MGTPNHHISTETRIAARAKMYPKILKERGKRKSILRLRISFFIYEKW